MKKTMKKLTCGVLAAVSVFGCAATMTACETSHPKVQMELAFNGKTYTLDYKLYRKVTPATVDHFLWLAGNGYYDGVCVHDYDSDSSRMYTGSYTVDQANATTLVYQKYFDKIKTYGNYNEFPHSVWLSEDKTLPTYTLKGEFEEENHYQVESGALQETYGSLTMHYEYIGNTDDASKKVYFANANDDGTSKRKYQQNHATSAFFISMTTNPKTNNNYCTFATLEEDSKSVLEDLQAAMDDYIEDNYSDVEDFTQTVTISNLFEDDAQVGDTASVDYNVPLQAIVIKKVTVKKY